MSAATVGPTPARGWPRRRILLALLVVSAVLNLFFVAGAVWSRLHASGGIAPWEDRYQRMASELQLDPQQRLGFDRYVVAMRARDHKMHQEIAPLIAGAWDEIAKPQADVGHVMQQFDEASRKWREFQREATTQTLEFLSILSPAQRRKFIAIQRERRAARLHHNERH